MTDDTKISFGVRRDLGEGFSAQPRAMRVTADRSREDKSANPPARMPDRDGGASSQPRPAPSPSPSEKPRQGGD